MHVSIAMRYRQRPGRGVIRAGADGLRRGSGLCMSVDLILLYGGASLALFSFICLIFFLCRYHLAARKLRKKLDEEYGAPIGR